MSFDEYKFEIYSRLHIPTNPTNHTLHPTCMVLNHTLPYKWARPEIANPTLPYNVGYGFEPFIKTLH